MTSDEPQPSEVDWKTRLIMDLVEQDQKWKGLLQRVNQFLDTLVPILIGTWIGLIVLYVALLVFLIVK